MGKYAAEERVTPEWPRHRTGNKFADRTLPTVVLNVDGEGQGSDDSQAVRERPALRPANPVMEVERVELPPNYFQTDDANKDTWLEEIVKECMTLGASDLLLTSENERYGLTAAARVDGRMRPIRRVDGNQARIIVGKFRAENNLATSGTTAPEETQYPLEVDGEERKARVAVFRKADGGEAIAMRLPPSGKLRRLHELSFSDNNLDAFYSLLSSSNRMLVIAGPMGEGKTTTAQAAVMHVATDTRTVWTVEDPVERILPGTIQLEVDPSQEAGYDVLLPALVRSDYDTLFLGEIRDKDTAVAGVRQAKAGRQVITTIHANNNITALLRLIDLAQDSPLSVLDSVKGIVSQRLVGRLNPDWDGNSPVDKYKGRVPIHEILTINDELTEAIMTNQPLSLLRGLAAHNSHSTFEEELEVLVRKEITDDAERLRILGE